MIQDIEDEQRWIRQLDNGLMHTGPSYFTYDIFLFIYLLLYIPIMAPMIDDTEMRRFARTLKKMHNSYLMDKTWTVFSD